MQRFSGFEPIVHISCHGDENCIQLSSEETLPWSHLESLLLPINSALNGTLLVAMSSCHGYAGIRMAMKVENGPLPFYALVGCASRPTWPETAIGFATFYHRLNTGAHVTEAVKAMNSASGRTDFYVDWGQNCKQEYLNFLDKQRTQIAVPALNSGPLIPPLVSFSSEKKRSRTRIRSGNWAVVPLGGGVL